MLHYRLPAGFPARNRKRLESYRDIHRGKRCFVVCNGPSLRDVDMSVLEGEYTIGMNRIYLMREVNGFLPSYLVVIAIEDQLHQFHDELDLLEIPSFFNYTTRGLFSKKPNQMFVKSRFSPRFSTDLVKDMLGNGQSVTYHCIQLAYHMGFDEVYLIGKDHSYQTAGAQVKTVFVADGKEDNHFIKGYYRPGMRWTAPDLDGEEQAYRYARKAFEDSGRVIKDATVNGKLEIFEKCDFADLF
jgi:6-hydroxymethylpterin diphosphokinase MptE-like